MKSLMERISEHPLTAFRDEMERMFDSFFNLKSFNEFSSEFKGFSIDISEDDKNYIIESDLPGIEKENLNIELKDNNIVITAEKHHSDEKRERKYYRMERSYGKYMRSIPLPQDADTGDINAEFKNGVLKITISKKPELAENVKRIEIK